ncbi:hypothetical protein [Clostridium senegalense]
MKGKTCYCCGKKINEKEDCFYWDNTEPREAMCINCLIKMTSKYKKENNYEQVI